MRVNPVPASPLRLSLVFLVLTGILGGSLWAIASGRPEAALWVTATAMTYEALLASCLSVLGMYGLWSTRRDRAGFALADPSTRPTVAVLIAAYNERLGILETVRSVRENAGMACRIVIASDGSDDGMDALCIEQLGLVADGPGRHRSPSGDLLLLSLPRRGKGHAMNAALAHIDEEVTLTLDADTTLGPAALVPLAEAFRDPRVEAAGGYVAIRNPRESWLSRFQFTEYVKNFGWRMGLGRLGLNLQISGAFGAMRTATLREVGGFAGDSLVEDYEVIHRIHAHRYAEGRPHLVLSVPDAVAFTDGPTTLGSFARQRIRWFAGFLQTQWDYRHMVFSVRHGRIGLVMLPLKCLDATLPLWSLATLVLLITATLSGRADWGPDALSLFLAKWAFDAGLFALLVVVHHLRFRDRPQTPSLAYQLPTALLEGLVFHWPRQVAVTWAYVWFARRTKRWEQPRWRVGQGERAHGSSTSTNHVSAA